MTKNEFAELRKEKSDACISVIVPTHRLSPERRADELILKRAVTSAKELLEEKYAGEITATLKSKLDELFSRVDFLHNKEGLGLFVSSSIQKIVKFPFAVKEKVVIKESFELRDLLFLNNCSSDYYLLEINEKSARLFKGSIDELEEIKDENFPQKHSEVFEYSKPARGSSYVGNAFVKEFEKDKSVMEEIRMQEFLRAVDKLLGKYLSPGSFLLLSGTEKNIALFKSVSKHTKSIIGIIPGNESHITTHELGSLAWLKMSDYINNQKFNLVKTYEEKAGEGLGVEGIEEVWKAAKEGRGLILLVEKDYLAPGFIRSEDNSLHLKKPKLKSTTVPDVVEDIIETIMNKDGEVMIMENNLLIKHEQIALITRY